MKLSKCKLILIKEKEFEYEKLNNPTAIYNFLRDSIKLNEEPEEVVIMLALDNKKKLLCCCEVSRGGIDSAVLSPRDVYKRALVANAKSIIIAHNHPAGSINPSFEDKIITEKIKDAGEILDVSLLDHIIVGEKGYYSFFENNPDLIIKDETKKFYNNQTENKEKYGMERSL